MIYVTIPAYNEEANLGTLVSSINEILKGDNKDFLIIVIDDGSTDRTREIALRLAESIPLEVLSHRVNKGAGGFFKTGFERLCKSAVSGDVLVFMEADCTNDPKLLPRMIRKVEEGHDVVVGSRYLKGGGYRGFPLKRRILSSGANALMRFFFPIRGIKDYTIFYRAYSRDIIRKALDFYKDSFITSKSFLVNSEILVKLNRLGFKGTEVPLLYKYDLKRSKSHMEIRQTLFDYLRFIVRVKFFRYVK